jgi:hypothetical protein
MATPPYVGASPAVAAGDNWFARLTSYFAGSGTPIYDGVGQPAPTGVLQSTPSPIYAAAPTESSDAVSSEPALTVEQEFYEDSCPIDPAALAAGQIAIVIPRERLGP